ncbi:MAG: PIN domain-containing protein [Bryobacteraceae bacterium]|jgi:predicted nucleic acid-binding protein
MSSAPGGESLKAALDTNIYVAAFNATKGRNARLWDAALTGRLRLVVSPAIIREMASLLRDKLAWQDERVSRMPGLK